MNGDLAAEAWARLSGGEPLEDLGLGTVGGRADLRGLVVPRPGPEVVELRGVRWTALDFSGAQLERLRFHDCAIESCSFERARCGGWRVWGSSFVDTSFRGADLREAALGPVSGERRNAFRRVDFGAADLRRSIYVSAEFDRCAFDGAKLAKIEFGGSTFVDCTFAGKLEEVVFHRHASGADDLPPNEMRDVDLRRATLRFVEFRGLDMTTVRWPEGDGHVIIHDYPAALERVIAALRGRTDVASRRLRVVCESRRKWAGPNQKTGVIAKADLVEAGGQGAVAEFARLVQG